MTPRPVLEVVAAALRIPIERVATNLSYQDVPEWDSMGHVSLMLAIEEEFGVQVTDDLAVELTSVDAITAFLAGRSGEPRTET